MEMVKENNDLAAFHDFCKEFDTGRNKVVIQTVVGRSGSLFFQGLWDGHPEIIMFPGMLNFYTRLWSQIEADPENWIDRLNDHWSFLELLAEPLNLRSGLGINGDEKIIIPKERILEILKYTKGSGPWTRKSFFLALHYSFWRCEARGMSDIRVIYCHEHTVDLNGSWMEDLKTDFNESMVFCCVKDPLANFDSIVSWRELRTMVANSLWSQSLYQPDLLLSYTVYWYGTSLAAAKSYPQTIKFIRLEDLKTDRGSVLNRCCKQMGIMEWGMKTSPTFYGKLWKGDVFSETKMSQKAGFYSMRILRPLVRILLRKTRQTLEYAMRKSQFWQMELLLSVITYPFWLLDDIRDRIRFGAKNYLNRFRWPIINSFMGYLLHLLSSVKTYSSYIRSEMKLSSQDQISILSKLI